MPSTFLSQIHESLDLLPWVEFATPLWLVLIPLLCIAAWLIARRALGGWHGGRQTVALVVRCLVIIVLCSALAQPSLRWPAKSVTVVVVRDVSRSVPIDQQLLADQFVGASTSRRIAGDLLAAIDTAGSPSVRLLPTSAAALPDSARPELPMATNLDDALRLARGLIPSETAGRVLLISDGNPTTGDLRRLAHEFAAAKVPLDIASVEYDRRRGVRVRSLDVPTWTRQGAAVAARITIESGRAAEAALTIMLNGTMLDLDPSGPGLSSRIHLEPGLTTYTLPIQIADDSTNRFQVFLEPLADDRSGAAESADDPAGLQAEAVSFAATRGRVLLVANQKEEYSEFVNAISSEDVVVETMPVTSMPDSLVELAGYDAIILANQPVTGFPIALQEALVRYVFDAGGGLLVLGGPESYGAGGWIGSPLSDALPVVLDPLQKRQMPMGALALVIDCSGSMQQSVAGTGSTQQALANESAILGIRALSRLDEVTVIAFSGGYEVVVPLTTNGHSDSVARRIRSIGSGGGTVLFPALQGAAQELSKSQAGVKHIIVMTDGQTVGSPAEGYAIARDIARRGITISTIAIGDGSNDALLQQIAVIAKGRAHAVNAKNSLAQLPQIFIKEAITVRRTLIWEGPAFSPKVEWASESLKGIPTPLPRMRGYVVTADRGGLSTVLLRSPENDPILAQWQHGLGRVVAYTSDATTRWNAPWAQWPSFDAFWRQQVRWAMRPSSDPNARATVVLDGDRAKVVVELLDSEGDRLNFARVRGRVTPPEDAVRTADGSEDIQIRQVGPGRYEGAFDARADGVHLLWLRYDAAVRGADGETVQRSGTLRAATVRRLGDELREPLPNSQLLTYCAVQTGGRAYRLDAAGANLWQREGLVMPRIRRSIWLMVALAAIGMFLADVAIRRIAIDSERIVAWAQRMFTAAPAVSTASVQALSRVKPRGASAPPYEGPESPSPAHAPPAPLGSAGPFQTAAASISPQEPPNDAAITPQSEPRPAQSAEGSADRMDRLRAAKRRRPSDE